jgi:hypothetical protein
MSKKKQGFAFEEELLPFKSPFKKEKEVKDQNIFTPASKGRIFEEEISSSKKPFQQEDVLRILELIEYEVSERRIEFWNYSKMMGNRDCFLFWKSFVLDPYRAISFIRRNITPKYGKHEDSEVLKFEKKYTQSNGLTVLEHKILVCNIGIRALKYFIWFQNEEKETGSNILEMLNYKHFMLNVLQKEVNEHDYREYQEYVEGKYVKFLGQIAVYLELKNQLNLLTCFQNNFLDHSMTRNLTLTQFDYKPEDRFLYIISQNHAKMFPILNFSSDLEVLEHLFEKHKNVNFEKSLFVQNEIVNNHIYKQIRILNCSKDFTRKSWPSFVIACRYLHYLPLVNHTFVERMFTYVSWRIIIFLIHTRRGDILIALVQRLLEKFQVFFKETINLVFDLILFLDKYVDDLQNTVSVIEDLKKSSAFRKYLKKDRFCTFKILGIGLSGIEYEPVLSQLISECRNMMFRTNSSIYQVRIFYILKCIKSVMDKGYLTDNQIFQIVGMSHFIMQASNASKNTIFERVGQCLKRTILKIISLIINLKGVSFIKNNEAGQSSRHPFDIAEFSNLEKFYALAIRMLNFDFFDIRLSDDHFQLFLENDLVIADLSDQQFTDLSAGPKYSQSTVVNNFSQLIKIFTSTEKQGDMIKLRNLFHLVSEKCTNYTIYFLPITCYHMLKTMNAHEVRNFAVEIQKILEGLNSALKTGLILSLNFLGLYILSDDRNINQNAKRNYLSLKDHIEVIHTWDTYLSLDLNHKLIYEMEHYYTNKNEKITPDNLKIYLKAFSKISSDMQNTSKSIIKNQLFSSLQEITPEKRMNSDCELRSLGTLNQMYKNNKVDQWTSIRNSLLIINKALKIHDLHKPKTIKWVFRVLDVLIIYAFQAIKSGKEIVMDTLHQTFFGNFEFFLSYLFKVTLNFTDTNIVVLSTIFRLYLGKKIFTLIIKKKINRIGQLLAVVLRDIEKFSLSSDNQKELLRSINYISSFFDEPDQDLFIKSSLMLSKIYRKSKNLKKSKYLLDVLAKCRPNASPETQPLIFVERSRVEILSGITFEAAKIANALIELEIGEEIRIKATKIFIEHNINCSFKRKILEVYELPNIEILVGKSEELAFQKAIYFENNIFDNFDEKIRLLSLLMKSCMLGNKYIMRSVPKFFNILHEIIALIDLNSKVKEEVAKRVKLESIMKCFVDEIPAYKLVIHLQLFLSRIMTNHSLLDKFIQKALAKIIDCFPLQSIWWFMSIYYFSIEVKNDSFRNKAKDILSEVSNEIRTKYQKCYSFIDLFIRQFTGKKKDFNMDSLNNEIQKLKNQNISIILPLRRFLYPSFPTKADNDEFQPFQGHPIFIEKISEKYSVLPSKEAPIKISFIGSDKVDHIFVIKYEPSSDVRKESRNFYFIEYLNFLINTDKSTKEMKFHLPSFNILSLNRAMNLIEWVENSRTIRSLFEERKISCEKYANESTKIRKVYPAQVFEYSDSDKYVLKEFIFKISSNEIAWYNKYINFIKSWAAWSVFCFVIRLGDRHYDNVLILEESGKTIQIDFDCIFDKGRTLPCPETVDFRLTSNIMKAFGVTECWGLFHYYFKLLMEVCVRNIDNIMGNLEIYLIDPLIDTPQVRNKGGYQKVIDEEEARLNKIAEQKIQLNSVRRNIMSFATKDIDEKTLQLLLKNSHISTLQNMYFGWAPHL